VILSDLAKYSMTRSVARYLCDSQWLWNLVPRLCSGTWATMTLTTKESIMAHSNYCTWLLWWRYLWRITLS